MSLLVVGSVALDNIETAEDSQKNILGGSASYFSMGASLFCPVQLVAVVGEDFPQKHIDLLASRPIDLTGLQRTAGKTFRWSGRYSVDFASRTTLSTELNVFADFDPCLPEDYRATSHVFLANIHPSLQLKVLDQLADPKFVAADTMNFWIDGALPDLQKLIKRLDLLIINDEEVRLLGGGSSILEAAQNVLALGPKALIVKRGEHGSTLFSSTGMFFLPAYPVRKVLDPTGAGDTFASGLMGYLASRAATPPTLEDFKQAMSCATALSSFVVEGFSLQGLVALSLDDVHRRYHRLAELTHFPRLEEF
jgi:sugar/nucleoside kinase (ribokinase family)